MPATARAGFDSTAAGRLPHDHDHVVQFYDDDDFLCASVATFVEVGLTNGQPVVIIATEEHREAFCRMLFRRGVEIDAACSSGQMILCDARETLASFLVDGKPDWQRFQAQIGGVLEKASRASAGPIRAYGEMVDLLWKDGKPQDALLLEQFWNDLSRTHSFALLCAYVLGNFHKEADGPAFGKLCGLHSRSLPAESYPREAGQDFRLAEISRLQQRARALEHEIERRKQAEGALHASQQELLDFFENAAEGLHRVGPDGTILWANRAELDLLGYAEHEYIGHNIVEFHADRERIDDMLARLARNETLRDCEARLRCKDGTIKHVVIHSNALFRDGQFVHTRCFTRDITDRKRLEEDLRRQNEDLLRTVRFSEMFVGILGHDLRNPLSAITTAASLLTRRADSDKVVRPAARILSSAGRMARMIDQLLDFTRIRLGQGLPLSRRENDLAEVCRIAADELDGDPNRIELHALGDTVGSWDGDRLMQLVSNLVGNALAHGAPTAPAVVTVDGKQADEVIFTVRNAGAIAPEMLPVIFEPFRSGKDRKEDQSSGLGLGLYISQQIVLAHSGSLEVRSKEEEGTCFTVRLPRG